MKRTILFRIWDVKNKTMYYPYVDKKPGYLWKLTFDCGGLSFDIQKIISINKDDIAEEEELFLYNEEDYQLMQSIGIKDVNGKEIFEGDIIIAYDKLAVIEYCEGTYEIISIHNEYLGRFCSASTIIEVKGNIYENPELLLENEDDKWTDYHIIRIQWPTSMKLL